MIIILHKKCCLFSNPNVQCENNQIKTKKFCSSLILRVKFHLIFKTLFKFCLIWYFSTLANSLTMDQNQLCFFCFTLKLWKTFCKMLNDKSTHFKNYGRSRPTQCKIWPVSLLKESPKWWNLPNMSTSSNPLLNNYSFFPTFLVASDCSLFHS